MIDLQNTEIFRSGVSCNYWKTETQKCMTGVHGKLPGRFIVQFKIAAGRGMSDVQIRIGKKDLPGILNQIAEEFPEALLGSGCVETAHKRMIEKVRELEKQID